MQEHSGQDLMTFMSGMEAAHYTHEVPCSQATLHENCQHLKVAGCRYVYHVCARGPRRLGQSVRNWSYSRL